MIEHTVRVASVDNCRVTLDTRALAQGIYDIMNEEDLGVLAFGMVPKHVHDQLERGLAGAFDLAMRKHNGGMAPETLDEFITELGLGKCTDCMDSRAAFIRRAVKETVLDLYAAASKAGKLLV